MFDEGENSVTIKLPQAVSESLKNSSTENSDMPISEFLRASSDYDYSSESMENNENNNDTDDMERDYSIQSWNNNVGLSYWGYDEKNQNNKV